MDYNIDEIRAYLLRLIANKNHRLSGMVDDANKFTSNRDPRKAKSYHDMFNKVVETFAGRSNTLDLEEIYQHIEENPKSRFNVYNYFDVDTLIAYDKFLTKFLSIVDLRSYECGRRRATMEDFSYGFLEVAKWLRVSAGSQDSGYYDKSRPIKIAKKKFNDKLIFNPQKPLSPNAFEKKYNNAKCERELKAYIESQHPTKSVREYTPDYIDYTYKGEHLRLEVESKDSYVDQEYGEVEEIIASGKEGRLYRTKYSSGEVQDEFVPNKAHWNDKEIKIVENEGMDQTTFF